MSKESKVLGVMATGRAFGELAILYNCRRTASVKGEGASYFVFCQAFTEFRTWVTVQILESL